MIDPRYDKSFQEFASPVDSLNFLETWKMLEKKRFQSCFNIVRNLSCIAPFPNTIVQKSTLLQKYNSLLNRSKEMYEKYVGGNIFLSKLYHFYFWCPTVRSLFHDFLTTRKEILDLVQYKQLVSVNNNQVLWYLYAFRSLNEQDHNLYIYQPDYNVFVSLSPSKIVQTFQSFFPTQKIKIQQFPSIKRSSSKIQ